jgi:uncharacterized protein DUF5658
MSALAKSLLLFTLNWLDGQLTILWIRLNVATEGNSVMARLLSIGEAPFISVKLAAGAVAAYVLYRCADRQIAQRGMKVALSVYCALMLVHAVTGFSTLGWHAPTVVLTYFASLPKAILASFS